LNGAIPQIYTKCGVDMLFLFEISDNKSNTLYTKHIHSKQQCTYVWSELTGAAISHFSASLDVCRRTILKSVYSNVFTYTSGTVHLCAALYLTLENGMLH